MNLTSRLLIFICCYFLFVCNQSAFAEPVKYSVGVTIPLSGRLADIGEDIRRGMQLAVERFSNESLQFELKFEDNQHSGALAATTAHKLLDVDRVDVLVSLWEMADVIAPIAEKKQVPHLSIRWDPKIAEDFKYTITVESTYRSYIDKTIELLKLRGVKQFGILTEEAQGWILASDYLKQQAPQHGLKVVDEQRYTVDNPDHRAIVSRILRKKPEMLVLLSNPPHTEILTRRIREANSKQHYTGYFEYSSEPELFEGVPFAAQFAVTKWFEEMFQKRFGEPMKARASHAYDIIQLIAVANAKSSQKLTGEQLMERLSNISNVPGASGTLNVSSSGTIEGECVFKTVKVGHFVVIGPQEVKLADR
jgi:ABC-type branched-subunit amino acid transport system substrate-binding protein